MRSIRTRFSAFPTRLPTRIAAALVCLLCVSLSGPSSIAEAPDAVLENTALENIEGKVVEVGSFGFGLVPDSDPGTRYAPTEPLPEVFREDGLSVVFSGELGDPSETSGRRWGTPIRVTSIERRPSDR